MTVEDIRQLIAAGKYDEALRWLDRGIENNPSDATLWYERGRLYWRLGQKSNAISDYEEAAYIDPESPARHALELARDVMDFYNTDMLNP